MQHLSVRPARESDLQAFLKLGEAIGETPGVWKKNPESDFHDLHNKMKEGKKIFLLGLLGEDIIVGFTIIHLFRKLDPIGFDPSSCTVGVAVHPNFRKRGFGTKLVQDGLEEAEARGIGTAYISTGIENTAMQRLAEKLKFARYAFLEKDGWRFTRYKRRI